MNFIHAADDFLLYLEIEKNYSSSTIKSYAYDLKLCQDFLNLQQRSLDLDDITPSLIRKFIQDQIQNQA